MTDRCQQCGVTADELAKPWGALVVSWSRWGKQLVVWAMCLRCERCELELGDKRAQAAIKEAERSGV